MSPLTLGLRVLQNRVGAVTRPSWCTYIVSFRCNARCKMCDSWRMKPGDEMTPEQAAVVFGKLGRLDVVRLTGGEPFLREDFAAIAAGVMRASRPAVLHITTNGSFPERVVEFVEDFAEARRLRFMVSFDGLPAEHDQNRGKQVTFEQALETIKRLVALRARFGLEVSVNHTVISAQSLADNEGIRAIMEPLFVEVHSVLAYADSAMYGAKLRGKKAEHLIVPAGYPLHPMLAGADVIGFVRGELERLDRYRSPLLRWGKRYYLKGLLARIQAQQKGNDQQKGNGQQTGNLQQHPSPQQLGSGPQCGHAGENGNGVMPVENRYAALEPPRGPRCVALRSHVRLLPDGSVPVCQFNTEKVGNLLHQSFEELWHAPQTRTSRRWVDDCPGCWAECEVMPNAIYTGDLLRPQ